MNLARPPTTSPIVDKRGFASPVWLEWWTGLQKEIESPALVAMFASFFRRPKKDDENAVLLGLTSQVFRRRPPRVIQTAWADRAKYAAGTYREGSLLAITDHPLLFVSKAQAWAYKAGHFRDTLANIPTAALGTADAGLLYDVTDYDHILRWSGSAWGWGTGNPSPSGIYGLFESAPTTNGWQLCNGSTVARLNADGTTTNVSVPDVTTPRYLIGALSASAVAAASGSTGAPSGTTEVQSGSGATVASSGHTHGPGTIALDRKEGILYYRR
jgi:hypothetical protein